MKRLFVTALVMISMTAAANAQGVCYGPGCSEETEYAQLITDTHLMIIEMQSSIYAQSMFEIGSQDPFQQCIANCYAENHARTAVCDQVYPWWGDLTARSQCYQAAANAHAQCLTPYQVCEDLY